MTRKSLRILATTGLAGVVLLLASATPHAAERHFDTSTTYNTGVYPLGAYPLAGKVADLNGDGAMDYVASNWWFSQDISVLINDDAGGYLAPAFHSIDAGSMGIEVADFTGDGLPDIVAANTGSSNQGTTVALLRNQGGGSFAPRQTFPAVTGPIGLVAADFNGDGPIDLAVAGYGHLGQGTQIALLINNGLGGFMAPALFFAGASPYDLEAGDLNGDGRPDLVVARDGFKVTVLMNAGGGGFAPMVEYIAQSENWAGDFYANAALGDVDNDGDLDVFYSSTRTQLDADFGAICLLRNQGDGTLGNRSYIVMPRYLGGAIDIALADVNDDSWVDLLTAHGGNGGWVVTLALGGGAFGAGVEYAGGNDPFKIAAVDADRDGDEDALVLNAYSLTLGVHLNLGNGVFLEPGGRDLEPLCGWMEAGDIDNDGDLDVVSSYAYAGGGGISVVKNNGDGTFAPRQNYTGPRGAMTPRLDDLNGDGSLDLVWAFDPTSPPYDFAVRLNIGGGTFGPATIWPVGGCGTGDLITMDVDQDGDRDVLLTDWLGCGGGGSSAWVWIRRNNGDATFAPPYVLTYPIDPHKMAVGDFDGDEKEDLVTTHADGVRLVRALGAGQFGPPAAYNLPDAPVALATGDLNGDGHLDLGTANIRGPWEGTISWLINQGNGTLGAPTTISATFSTEVTPVGELQAQDTDLDGDLDLLLLSYGAQDLVVHENDGNAGFTLQARYVVGPAPADFRCLDFDGDQRPDLAVVVGVPPANLNKRLVVARGLAVTAAVESEVGAPSATVGLRLHGSNPFTDDARFAFTTAQRGKVRLAVYDVSGRQVATLVDGDLTAGEHVATWNALGAAGERVSNGVYFARLATPAEVSTVRFLMMR